MNASPIPGIWVGTAGKESMREALFPAPLTWAALAGDDADRADSVLSWILRCEK